MNDEQLTKNVTTSNDIVNIIEDLVRQKVDDMIKEFDMCD